MPNESTARTAQRQLAWEQYHERVNGAANYPSFEAGFAAGVLAVLGDLSDRVLEHGICARCGALCDSTCPECRGEGGSHG